jgi:hypothetical protein
MDATHTNQDQAHRHTAFIIPPPTPLESSKKNRPHPLSRWVPVSASFSCNHLPSPHLQGEGERIQNPQSTILNRNTPP